MQQRWVRRVVGAKATNWRLQLIRTIATLAMCVALGVVTMPVLGASAAPSPNATSPSGAPASTTTSTTQPATTSTTTSSTAPTNTSTTTAPVHTPAVHGKSSKNLGSMVPPPAKAAKGHNAAGPSAPKAHSSAHKGALAFGIDPTLFRSGQVFASVGNSAVNIYDPTSADLLSTLNDETDEPFTAGSAFDAAGNFYVTDDANGEISEYNSDGVLQPLFASGLSNPLSLAFDSSGNLYVGQQTTPYIAEFNSAGVRQPDIGPVDTELFGVDWIDLASDQCTIYYATEGNDILRYNKCTNTQLSNFNTTSFDPDQSAYELRILPDGSVLVADSNADLLLNSSGTLIHTYSCSALPDCEGQLFTLALDPDGTSFWTGDDISGDIWRIDISTGDILQTITTYLGANFGLTIAGETPLALAPLTAMDMATHMASKHSPGCQHQSTKGDPVDCASGDFYHTFSDASIPGYGPALDLTRTYNSLEASTEGIFGYGWTSSYESRLVVNEDGSITVTEADGSQVTATSDGMGGFVVPAWADSTLVQNEDGTYTFVRQQAQTFTFNSSGQLTSIADANGATTALAYSSGKLDTVTDPSGRTLTFAYGSNGLVSSVTDPMSRETLYGYDTSGDLTSVTDPLSRVTSFGYDTGGHHLLVTLTMPNGQSGAPDAGHSYTNTYDGTGRVLTQTDPTGQETTYAYTGDNFSDTGGTTTITDPDENVTVEDYTAGQMIAKTIGSSTWEYGYDQGTFGLDSTQDPDANTTASGYDRTGNLTSSINAVGSISTSSYNSFNEPTCAAQPLAGLPCSVLSPPSAITAGTSTITPPSSAPPAYVTYTQYDTDGNKIWTTTGAYEPGSSSASYSRTTYDLYNGQSVTLGSDDDSCSNTAPSGELPCATIDPNGVVTQLAYDTAGNLTSTSTSDGNSGGEVAKTTYGYDTDSEQTSKVAPDGNLSGANAGNYTTSTAYNDDGEKTSVTLGGASGHTVVPRTTAYTYDTDGNVISSTQNSSPELVGTAKGSNSSSSLALDLPKGTLSGDEVILSTTTSPSSGTESVTTPSGYTLVDSTNTGQTTTYVYSHTVGSGDTGVTLAYSTSDSKVAALAVYRGIDTSSPVDASGDATTSSGTSVAVSDITTTHPGDKLLFIGGAGQQGSAGTWTAPTDMGSKAQTTLSGLSIMVAEGPGPTAAGSSGTKTATTSVSGQLAAVFLALSPGSVESTTAYDADDRATLATNPDGAATLTCYDGDSNVAQTVPAVGVAASSLNAASCPSSYPSDYGDRLTTDATTSAYNGLDEKTTVTTPAPAGLSGYETTTSTYDAAGLLTQVDAPPTSTSGGAPDNVTDYTNDAAGEVLTTTTGAGTATAATTSTCYDPDGNKTATVAADGNTSSVATCSTSSPYGAESAYQTEYSFDSLAEVVSKTAPATSAAPSGQVTTYTYDPAGNQLTSHDPNGVTTTNTFTPLDQLATVSYSDSTHDASYSYDANGNRTAMTDASGTSSYSYNPFDELTSSENGDASTVSYTHDALGNTTSITYPLGSGATWADTDTVTYRYDPASQLTSVTDFNGHTSVMSNTADGLPSAVVLGSSGDTLSTSYAPTDDPSSITLGDGSTLQEFAYSNAPSGAIVSETDTPSSSLSPADYTYDAQSRVTQMTPGSGSAKTYAQDASNNLTTLPNGGSGTYDDASELTSSSLSGTTTDYTFDASGNRAGESVGGTGTVSATYNGAEQLKSYDNSAANTSSVTYDGDGLRTAATSTPSGGGASTEHFVWNTNTSVPQLLMDSDNAYLYGPSGTPFEQVDVSSGTVKYLVSDALGSVRGVVSSSGSLSNSTSYDAWGNAETSGGITADTPFGFAGGYSDPTGLLYLINRYYDPGTGQFVNVDSLVDETALPYSYTRDNPVNAVDPTGQSTDLPSLPVNSGTILAAECSGVTKLGNSGRPQQANELSGSLYTSDGENCGRDSADESGQVSGCASAEIIQVCVSYSDGHWYWSYGLGIGLPIPSISLQLGPAPESGCDPPTGSSLTIDGNYLAGGGVTLNSNGPVPYFEFGSPGAGIFFMNGLQIK